MGRWLGGMMDRHMAYEIFQKAMICSLEIDLIYDIKSVSVGRSDYVMSIQPGCEYAPTAHTNRCQLHTNLNSKK